jgi:hypothetical protein
MCLDGIVSAGFVSRAAGGSIWVISADVDPRATVYSRRRYNSHSVVLLRVESVVLGGAASIGSL